ncbi:MAG: bifunctional enoyl-CoA hydratase/phosphate acetyltransferase [Bacteroidales bacterium]|nr:bifunctional enoyl-CoA hydratase/phosphate acetyltransferase [Bacteroidales bacterium]MBN2757640.1 bifunctional enoyl-CoA hydratase/phosphate acetyltransferase [Bacteroidales bacterium]
MFTKLKELFEKNLSKSNIPKLVLAVAHDKHSLEAILLAEKKGIVKSVLVGIKTEIEKIAAELDFDLSEIEIYDIEDKALAVKKAIEIINNGKAQILMKGNVSTAILLKAVLNKEWGLNSGSLLSHLAIFELESYHKLLSITDVAMNIAPDVKEKIGITQNAVNYLNKIGIKNPKVAAISAAETVSHSMQSSIDAAIIAKMSERNQIGNCIIDGPLALDNAINKKSANHKGITSPVAGEADLLLMPNIETGNVFYKSLTFFAKSKVAAVILGAKVPIVLTSRSDSEETKLNSIYLAASGV